MTVPPNHTPGLNQHTGGRFGVKAYYQLAAELDRLRHESDGKRARNCRRKDSNQYTSVAGQGMSYDGNFNLTQFNFWGGWTYQYNAENQLTSAGGSYATFVYDALGRCVKRTIGSQTRFFAYDGWKPTVESIPRAT